MGKMALVMKWYDSFCYEMGTIALIMEMGKITFLMKWER